MHLIIPAVILLVIVLAIFGAIQNRKRLQALMAWASAHGLRFEQGCRYNIEDSWPNFGCLRHGENRYASMMIYGNWQGRTLTAFEYHYETHSTDSKGRRQTQTHQFSAAIFESPVPLKPLFIRPEGFFDKIGEFFGHDDIDFESAEFSKRFFVKAEDRKWAYDVIHARAMEFLLSRPNDCIQFEPRGAIVWDSGVYDVAKMETAIETLRGLLDMLPEYLVQQQESRLGEVKS